MPPAKRRVHTAGRTSGSNCPTMTASTVPAASAPIAPAAIESGRRVVAARLIAASWVLSPISATKTRAKVETMRRQSMPETLQSRGDLHRLLGGATRRYTRGIEHHEGTEAEPEQIVPARGHSLFRAEEPSHAEENEREGHEQFQIEAAGRRADRLVHAMEEARHVARLEQRITRRGLRGRGQVPGNGLLIEMRRDGNDPSGHGGNGVLPAHRIVVEDEHASRPGVRVYATDAADAPQGLLELTGEGRVALQPTDLEAYASRQGMDDPDR